MVDKEVKNGVLVAFGELFLKSFGVRKVMLVRLAQIIKSKLESVGIKFVIHVWHDRFFIETEDISKTLSACQDIFGISWVSEAVFISKGSVNKVAKFVCMEYPRWIGLNKTFALEVRHDKDKENKSKQEIIDAVALKIERKVDLKNPDCRISLEAVFGGGERGWLIYHNNKKSGLGGLPVGSQGRILSLISGGIDSPISSWFVARRGAENVWIHFHSFPLVSRRSLDKIEELAEIFLRYQPKLKIYFVPFSDIQLRIKALSPPKYRVLLYRRAMFKIACKIAVRENISALLTGESLGQVGSQTLTNLGLVEDASILPVLRPLVGMDKQEIITMAKQTGFYDISIKPQEDCCTLFTPKHPTASGNLEEIKKLEKELKLSRLINIAVRTRPEVR